jgi:PAS domain S-box-containing protein
MPPEIDSAPFSLALVDMHDVTAVAVALACTVISLSLLRLRQQHRERPLGRIFLASAVFALCGAAALLVTLAPLETIPDWLPAALQAITAVASIATAILLVGATATEIPPRGQIETLRHRTEGLEASVREGTAELAAANQRLQAEIAQRHQAELEVHRLNHDLQQRVGELQTLFDVLPVGVGIAADPECRRISTNPAFARILGISTTTNASLSADAQEAPSHFHVESGGRVLQPEELPMQRAVQEHRSIVAFEETVVHRDGRRIELLANAVPLHDEKGELTGCVATFQDITEQKRAEERQRELDRSLLERQKLKSLGVLAGGIAHDFNNLLTGVLGNANLARLDLPEDSPAQPCLSEIEEAARRAADLCRQMLAYAGHGRFVVVDVDLNTTVKECARLLGVSISNSCVLDYQLGATLPCVHADPSQLQQMIINLVTNASEAIGDRKGVITITTQPHTIAPDIPDTRGPLPPPPPGEYVCFEVKDDGCGMDAATLARVFDPFFTTKFTGRGLGLPAVLGIVRSHNGSIHLESEPGRGTTVRVLLPATRTDAAPAAVVPPNERPARLGSALVVDDEPAVRVIASRFLSRLGFSVDQANDGEAGVACFKAAAATIDLVLLDLSMPQLNGEAALRMMREIRPDAKILLMSGYTTQDAASRFQGNGPTGFIQKPFDSDALRTAIRDAGFAV